MGHRHSGGSDKHTGLGYKLDRERRRFALEHEGELAEQYPARRQCVLGVPGFQRRQQDGHARRQLLLHWQHPCRRRQFRKRPLRLRGHRSGEYADRPGRHLARILRGRRAVAQVRHVCVQREKWQELPCGGRGERCRTQFLVEGRRRRFVRFHDDERECVRSRREHVRRGQGDAHLQFKFRNERDVGGVFHEHDDVRAVFPPLRCILCDAFQFHADGRSRPQRIGRQWKCRYVYRHRLDGARERFRIRFQRGRRRDRDGHRREERRRLGLLLPAAWIEHRRLRHVHDERRIAHGANRTRNRDRRQFHRRVLPQRRDRCGQVHPKRKRRVVHARYRRRHAQGKRRGFEGIDREARPERVREVRRRDGRYRRVRRRPQRRVQQGGGRPECRAHRDGRRVGEVHRRRQPRGRVHRRRGHGSPLVRCGRNRG